MSTPKFVVDDNQKALRVRIKRNGVPVDLTNWTARLFAVGANNSDKPRTTPGDPWTGVLGVLIEPLEGLVDFQAIGDICDIGTNRGAQTYSYQVEAYGPTSQLMVSPTREFIVERRIPHS